MKQDIIIFDIDGTLANSEERAETFLSGDVKDWDSFYDNCDKDDCIQPTCDLCRMLENNPLYEVFYLTGRPESAREKTMAWMHEHNLRGRNLFMRKDGDHRPDYVFKKDVYETEFMLDYNVVAVFEDRQQCVDMWRELGITCYQVAKGDY